MVAVLLAADGSEPMPLGLAWGLAALLLVTGGLLAWVGALAARDRLPRNRGVGLRTPRTLASDGAWSAAHRVAGPWLVAGAAVIGIAGLVLLARPSGALGSVVVLATCGLLVALVAIGAVLGDRAAAGDPR